MTGERTKNSDEMEEQGVDTGYSWIVLSGSFFTYMLVLGSMKCFGVLYTEMLDHFSAGSGNTAWIASLAWFLLQGLAPLTVVLARRFSFRLVTFIGGLLVGCGYFFSGFVTRMELLYLTFTIAGVGYGLCHTSAVTIISFYFKKRRTLANGIMISAGGIAVLTFPFIYRFFIDEYGLSQAFWIIGAIHSNICVASCVFRQPKSLIYSQIPLSDNDAQGQIGEDNATNTCCEKLNLKFSLLKKRSFTLLLIALILCLIGQTNNQIIIPAHIKALGYSNTYVSIGVSINGGVDLVARLLVGWFADLNIVPKIYIFIVITFVGGTFALISPLFDSFTFMAVYAGVIAAFPSNFFTLMSVLTIERVGMKNFQAAFALLSVFMAFASMICLPITGWLADYYGNWYASFIFTGIAQIISSAVILVETVMIRNGTIKKDTIEKAKGSALENVDTKLGNREDCVHFLKGDTKETK